MQSTTDEVPDDPPVVKEAFPADDIVEDLDLKLKVTTPTDEVTAAVDDDDASSLTATAPPPDDGVAFYDNEGDSLVYVNYRDETQMPDIMRLIQKDLSEPYSIYTYRYFIHNWPQLCFLVSWRNVVGVPFDIETTFSP